MAQNPRLASLLRRCWDNDPEYDAINAVSRRGVVQDPADTEELAAWVTETVMRSPLARISLSCCWPLQCSCC